MKSLRALFFIPLLGLVGLMGIGVAPSSAAPSLGTGLIRLDAGWATVKTLPNGEMVLTLDNEANGQWMGELGDSLVPVVRNIDDRRVAKSWGAFGHTPDAAVETTLTWNSLDNYQLVELSEPRLTPSGHLRFNLTTERELPLRLEQVSVNVTRADAPQNRSFPVTENFILTLNASTQTTIPSVSIATVQFNVSGADIVCYQVNLDQYSLTATLPSNLACPDTTYTSGRLTLTTPSTSVEGNVFLTANMVCSGSLFSFNGIIAQWSQTGS